MTYGTLYLVGTPIGNLEDMTFRAVRVLREVDLIAAEDTRHTGKLLQHFQIQTPQISYHQHNCQQRLPDLLAALTQGKAIALVSDAGMPGISDPGEELVRACAAADIAVVPIPGATAAVTALCASGLAMERFTFEGFLPTKGKPRQQRLTELQGETRTVILYEAPHRVMQTLQDLLAALGGDRSVVLARELTKMHEEFWRGSLAQAIAHLEIHPPKGEYVLVLAGAEAPERTWSEAALKTELENLLAQGWTRSQATRHLAEQTSLSKRDLYQLSLTLDDPGRGDRS